MIPPWAILTATPAPTSTSAPAPSAIAGIPDIALGAILGAVVAGLVAFIGHLLTFRTARQNRTWESLWPKKVDAYEKLVRWSFDTSTSPDKDIWVLTQAYASQGVRNVVDAYRRAQQLHQEDEQNPAPSDKDLQLDLGREVRKDLRSTRLLG